MTEAKQSSRPGGVRPGGDHMDGRVPCRIENKIIINNDRKREAAGSAGTISVGVRGEARRKRTRLRNKGGGTDFYRLGLAGAVEGGGVVEGGSGRLTC